MNCLNCGATLQGQFCADCGQRHDTEAPTVGHLLAETVESLTHGDSRLWITLRQLIVRPGFLTQEFFAGRRASYLPPIRLYLLVSVGFFLLLSLLPESSVSPIVEADSDQRACADIEYRGPWGAAIEPRLRIACQRVVEDGGAALGEIFLRNVPKAMFLLLPLFAALMWPFFWRPRRLYAEHAIFLVHVHTACFLTLTIATLIGALIPEHLDGWLPAFVAAYLGWYVFRGMRIFYNGTGAVAALRFIALGLVYLACAIAVLAFTGIASMLEL